MQKKQGRERTISKTRLKDSLSKTRQEDNPIKNKEGRQPSVFRLQIYRYKGATPETGRQSCRENKTVRKPSVFRFNPGNGGYIYYVAH